MHEVSVDRTITDGTELLVGRVHGREGDDEYVYARPVGQDTWFNYVGTDSTRRAVDPFAPEPDSDRRAAVDRVLLDRGYPIRTQDGTTPPEGQLEIRTRDGTRARTFHTHPGTFVVYEEEGPAPKQPPSDDEVHVAILERTDDRLRVRVDAPGGPPPEYAIREATLAPFGHAQTPADLPTLVIDN